MLLCFCDILQFVWSTKTWSHLCHKNNYTKTWAV